MPNSPKQSRFPKSDRQKVYDANSPKELVEYYQNKTLIFGAATFLCIVAVAWGSDLMESGSLINFFNGFIILVAGIIAGIAMFVFFYRNSSAWTTAKSLTYATLEEEKEALRINLRGISDDIAESYRRFLENGSDGQSNLVTDWLDETIG